MHVKYLYLLQEPDHGLSEKMRGEFFDYFSEKPADPHKVIWERMSQASRDLYEELEDEVHEEWEEYWEEQKQPIYDRITEDAHQYGAQLAAVAYNAAKTKLKQWNEEDEVKTRRKRKAARKRKENKVKRRRLWELSQYRRYAQEGYRKGDDGDEDHEEPETPSSPKQEAFTEEMQDMNLSSATGTASTSLEDPLAGVAIEK